MPEKNGQVRALGTSFRDFSMSVCQKVSAKPIAEDSGESRGDSTCV